ncbi:MAG: metallophosphoesterase [Firmicutes bacterium]|nr:metallophosphoesterase [Bacillota bacterium]
MNLKVVLFVAIFLTIYGLGNYYIGLRGWQGLQGIAISSSWSWIWVAAVAILALSYPLGRLMVSSFPHDLARLVIFIGSYWMAAMYYLLIILLLADLTRFFVRWTDILPASLRGHFDVVILGVLTLVALLLLYGTWNAMHPVVRNYEVTLAKKTTSLESMRVVVVSDVHLGWIVGIDRLEQMTEIINSLQPDLVLLPGDIVDEGVDLEAEQIMPAILQTLHPRLGTYFAMGNHEYISGKAEATIGFLNRGGINVLRDQVYEITDGFYIVGRDDASRSSFNGGQRLELSELMSEVDSERLPVILLDHQPFHLEIADQAGVDLQFSGHTHLGQMFPNNYITQAIFEQDWGYLRKNNFQVIVSCGFGTWGPPIRIGNRPEILNVLVHFADPSPTC